MAEINYTWFSRGNWNERDNMEALSISGKTELQWILK
jgi:hypothetical protein